MKTLNIEWLEKREKAVKLAERYREVEMKIIQNLTLYQQTIQCDVPPWCEELEKEIVQFRAEAADIAFELHDLGFSVLGASKACTE